MHGLAHRTVEKRAEGVTAEQVVDIIARVTTQQGAVDVAKPEASICAPLVKNRLDLCNNGASLVGGGTLAVSFQNASNPDIGNPVAKKSP